MIQFYVQKYIMIQYNHLIFTIHNYFIKLNPFSKKCPICNTELRGYFCIFCISLCKVLYDTRSGISKSYLFQVWSFIRVIEYKIEKLRFLDWIFSCLKKVKSCDTYNIITSAL